MDILKVEAWWTRQGAVINVDNSTTTPDWNDFKFEKYGNDSIILRCEQSKELNYFAVAGENNQLRAIATREEATRFKVWRVKERLRTRIRGVNIASWFLPERWSNEKFFH